MSIGVEISVNGIERVQQRMLSLSRDNFSAMLEEVGGLVESQVRRRISEQKTSPDGKNWPAWSDSYARTRHGNHSLLENEGDLLDSIQYVINGDELEVGSNVKYAATHQFGDKRLAFGKVDVVIPPRPFLGLSDADMDEVVEVIDDFIDDITKGRRR